MRRNRKKLTAKLDQHDIRHAQYPLLLHHQKWMVIYGSKLAVWWFYVTGWKYFITVRNRS